MSKETNTAKTQTSETKEITGTKNQVRATEIFKNYLDCKEVHFASDGTPFFQKGDADNYAKGLKNKTLSTIKK